VVVEGRLDTGNGPGLPVRLRGWRMRIACESVTALKGAHLHRTAVVLFDLVLPGRTGLRTARRLRRQAGFRKADLVAIRRDDHEAALSRSQGPGFDWHLVRTLTPAELRELVAAVEDQSLATAL
jgi:DNA-binding response OmpR family regulator